jgi:hypothetical protein
MTVGTGTGAIFLIFSGQLALEDRYHTAKPWL